MDTVVKDALSRVSLRDRKHSADDEDKQHESGFEDSYHHDDKLTDEEGRTKVLSSMFSMKHCYQAANHTNGFLY